MELLDRVRRTIRRHQLAGPETRVIAAISGGSDSVALAHLLETLDRAGELRLVGLAHFNHQLREAADCDEQLCVDVAGGLNRSLVVDRDDVRARARRERRSLEDAARSARHAFLERARAELGADRVALGHTADDQAETFLLRLMRGTGARGLGSMHPRRGALVRPLIECRRDDLRAYLQARQFHFVHDESNDNVSIPRNRVRAELLPLMRNRFNPSIVEVLAHDAEIARDEHEYLETVAGELWPRAARQEGDRWLLDVHALGQAPLAIRRILLRRAMVGAAAGRAVGYADVERALALIGGVGPSFDGPGQRVQRVGADVVLTGRPAGAVGRVNRSARSSNLFQYPLSIPGEVLVAETGCRLSAEVGGPIGADAVSGGGGVAVVRLDKCSGALSVRNRRPGDGFRPFGLGRRKKLQDFFVDRKVARELRDLVPIVVDEADRIVWVAGHAIDNEFRVTDTAQAVIILRLKGLGGSA